MLFISHSTYFVFLSLTPSILIPSLLPDHRRPYRVENDYQHHNPDISEEDATIDQNPASIVQNGVDSIENKHTPDQSQLNDLSAQVFVSQKQRTKKPDFIGPNLLRNILGNQQQGGRYYMNGQVGATDLDEIDISNNNSKKETIEYSVPGANAQVQARKNNIKSRILKKPL